MTGELVTVTIEGVQIKAPKGMSIIEAAKQVGIVVPHYCYHPSLPAPAVCRMCLVEVEKAPKLMPACVTTVTDGQVVHINSESAKAAREGVLEMLLINHPLDCPICDQAGECELQDYTFQEGRKSSRYDEYAKRFNPVEDFGPDILYVPNRCILCTRCVRFMDDVAHDAVLNVSERGDRAFIGIDQDHRLDHPWSGNVVDLCPVGSLISKDFLHKARAWDMDKSGSICPGCSQGCNMTIDTRDGQVVRLRPRPNLDVNRHFMCDEGRADYRWMNRGDRIEAPLVRDSGRHGATDWNTALAAFAGLINGRSSVILASGGASTESLGLLLQLLGDGTTAAVQIPLGEEAPLPGIPDLALRRERAANARGAELVGYTSTWEEALISAGSASLVVVLDVELTEAERGMIGERANVIVLGTVVTELDSRAALVLPVSNLAEEIGTFVNRDGRVQRYTQARMAPNMARPAWWIAAETLAVRDSGFDPPSDAAEAFGVLAGRFDALGGITHGSLGLTGQLIPGARTAGAS